MATVTEEFQAAAARMISEHEALKWRVVLLPDRDELERRWKEAESRADAAEKRALDAERELAGSAAIVEAVAEALGLDRHGGDDLPAAVRALKTRCEGAERAASAMDGSAYVRGVARDRDEWRTRALTAEGALEERNLEVGDWEASARNWEREAASLRARVATLVRERDDARELSATYSDELATMSTERWRTAMLRGKAPGYYIAKADRTAWIRALIASLPSPSSPKTGRWKCGRCSGELSVVGVGGQALELFGGAWTWHEEHSRPACWLHWCLGWGGFPADRIGDAPEVTP